MPYLKVCSICSKEYAPSGHNQKYCSKECYKYVFDKAYSAKVSYRSAVKSGRIENPGAGSGYGSPSGVLHHNYKTGIGTFRAFKKDKCERCQSTKFLCVHHKDENRENNKLSNLETLCKSCHQEHHCNRLPNGTYGVKKNGS
jgi:hypothetical protein